jgi:hypothetical protein
VERQRVTERRAVILPNICPARGRISSLTNSETVSKSTDTRLVRV